MPIVSFFSIFPLYHNQSDFSNQNVITSLYSSKKEKVTSRLESELLGSQTSGRARVSRETKEACVTGAGRALRSGSCSPLNMHYKHSLRFRECVSSLNVTFSSQGAFFLYLFIHGKIMRETQQR